MSGSGKTSSDRGASEAVASEPTAADALLAGFWPAFVAYVDELAKGSDLDFKFGYQASCGNEGGCDPDALSRAVQQRTGRMGWPVADPSTLQPRDILDLVEFFYECVAFPVWEICDFCERSHVTSGDQVVARERYTSAINALFRQCNQSLTLHQGKVGDSSKIAVPVFSTSTETMRNVLDEADVLIQSHGRSLVADRAMAALHAYIQAACESKYLSSASDGNPSTSELFARLRTHPALRALDARHPGAEALLNALSSVLDATQAMRLGATLEPSGLLGDAEAMLLINSARAIFEYLDVALSGHSGPTP